DADLPGAGPPDGDGRPCLDQAPRDQESGDQRPRDQAPPGQAPGDQALPDQGPRGQASGGRALPAVPAHPDDPLARLGVPPLPELPWAHWVGEVPAELAQRIACDAEVWRAILDPTTGLP